MTIVKSQHMSLFSICSDDHYLLIKRNLYNRYLLRKKIFTQNVFFFMIDYRKYFSN